CDPLKVGRQFLEKIEPFGRDTELAIGKAGDVAAGIRQTGDKTLLDRVGTPRKHNGYVRARAPHRSQRPRTNNKDDIGCQARQLRRIDDNVSRETLLEADIAVLGPTKFGKP